MIYITDQGIHTGVAGALRYTATTKRQLADAYDALAAAATRAERRTARKAVRTAKRRNADADQRLYIAELQAELGS